MTAPIGLLALDETGGPRNIVVDVVGPLVAEWSTGPIVAGWSTGPIVDRTPEVS